MDFSASTFMAPYLDQFSAVMQNMHFLGAIFCIIFVSNYIIFFLNIPELHLLKDKFSWQHQHQRSERIQKSTKFNGHLELFGANKVQL